MRNLHLPRSQALGRLWDINTSCPAQPCRPLRARTAWASRRTPAEEDLGAPFSNHSLRHWSYLNRGRPDQGLAWAGLSHTSNEDAKAMGMQSILALGFILFSASLAVFMTRRRILGRWSWIIANALVVLGGVLALWLAQDWAGWLTVALFAVLVLAPSTLLGRARLAAQRGQWTKAARLHCWALILHPSPWTRFGLILRRALSKDATSGYVTALTQIEATGSQKQKALARLMLAHEQRDWERLLTLARAGNVDLSEAKPREVRALGELGRRDEMLRAYQG